MSAGLLLPLVALMLWPACDRETPEKPGGAGRVASGTWGGEHIGLEVTDTGAQVEYDCAHGTIDGPLTTDGRGRFDVKGHHVKEHGGPQREGEGADSHPARYTGQTDGRVMTLTVTLTDTEERIGTFRLARGKTPIITKCL